MNPERNLFPSLPPRERRLFPQRGWERTLGLQREWYAEHARVPARRYADDPISRVDCPRCGFWVWCRQSEIAWWLDGHLNIRHGKEEL